MTSAAPKPPKGHFNVLYFASAGSFTSREHEAFPAPLALSKLFDAIEERHGGIKDRILSSCLVTVNLEYIDVASGEQGSADAGSTASFMIKEGDEVAIIPPVSSG